MERLLATYRQAHEGFPRTVPRWVGHQSEGREKASDGNSHSRAELLGSERHFLMEATS